MENVYNPTHKAGGTNGTFPLSHGEYAVFSKNGHEIMTWYEDSEKNQVWWDDKVRYWTKLPNRPESEILTYPNRGDMMERILVLYGKPCTETRDENGYYTFENDLAKIVISPQDFFNFKNFPSQYIPFNIIFKDKAKGAGPMNASLTLLGYPAQLTATPTGDLVLENKYAKIIFTKGELEIKKDFPPVE